MLLVTVIQYFTSAILTVDDLTLILIIFRLGGRILYFVLKLLSLSKPPANAIQ